MNTPHPDLTSRTARALVDVVPAVNRTLRALVVRRLDDGLSLTQYRAMVHLKDRPGLTLKDLADREGVEPPSMSRTVDSLVETGWVVRSAGQTDRRCLHLVLTDAGVQVVERLRTGVGTQVADLLEGWPPEALEALLQGLSLLQTSSLHPAHPEDPR